MNKFTIKINPESATGYTQTFTYDADDHVCREERIGNGRYCFMTYDREYDFTPEAWEDRIKGFREQVDRLNATWGDGTAFFIEG